MFNKVGMWFWVGLLCATLAGCGGGEATATAPVGPSPERGEKDVAPTQPPAVVTPSATPVPPTPTSAPEYQINVLMRGCDTDLDVVNRLGEVTNAYVTVQNVGAVDLTNLEITLEASDEAETHIDKSYQVQHLPAGYEVSVRLTVDTQSGTDTSVEVVVTADEGVQERVARSLCRSYRMDESVLEEMGKLFKVVVIRVK